MPYTAKQKRFFGAEIGRLEEGKATKTGMTKEQLVEGIHSKTRKKGSAVGDMVRKKLAARGE
jgi:hypothetical protein